MDDQTVRKAYKGLWIPVWLPLCREARKMHDAIHPLRLPDSSWGSRHLLGKAPWFYFVPYRHNDNTYIYVYAICLILIPQLREIPEHSIDFVTLTLFPVSLNLHSKIYPIAHWICACTLSPQQQELQRVKSIWYPAYSAPPYAPRRRQAKPHMAG
jgi:hypothetical protein